MLPLGPVGHGHSPYSSHSAFAGSPLLVSPDLLIADGLVDRADAVAPPPSDPERVDFARVISWKTALLRRAWRRFHESPSSPLRPAFDDFRSGGEQQGWLFDWALFSALKHRHGDGAWTSWPDALRRREPAAIEAIATELEDEIAFHEFVQFLFYRQWHALKTAARAHGISILGDLPIYVAHDSADVWASPHLFDLGPDLLPRFVAGVPPDYFSKTGQLWGNPLYLWDLIARDGFSWWIARLRANLRLADLVRIDHFRAFAGYWAVPASEKTAVNGSWRKAPGRRLFRAVREALGDVPIVAEDLGHITPDVERLIDDLGFPRMKVLQFAFDGHESTFLPHRFDPNVVVYTGTHDNDTTRGWWDALGEEARVRARDYMGVEGREIEWDLIRAAYTSVAQRAIVPLQDVFGKGSPARMNTPAKPDGNWEWRARKEDFTPARAGRLRRLAELSSRA